MRNLHGGPSIVQGVGKLRESAGVQLQLNLQESAPLRIERLIDKRGKSFSRSILAGESDRYPYTNRNHHDLSRPTNQRPNNNTERCF